MTEIGEATGAAVPATVSICAFSLTAIEHPARPEYVLVHEKGERGWWLPGGGVDAGQTLQEAAVREAEEEAGCLVELTGVLRVELMPFCHRLRVIWAGRPKNADAPLKSVPDAESRGATWTTLADTKEIDAGRLRVDHC